MEGTPKPPNRYRIESVFQAGEILKLITDAHEPLGPTEISQRLDVTMNTAFRMCVTLEEMGFLRQIGGKYELGTGMSLLWARKKAALKTEKERIEKDLLSLGED